MSPAAILDEFNISLPTNDSISREVLIIFEQADRQSPLTCHHKGVILDRVAVEASFWK
jgi:hypothetical protein